VQTNTEHTMKTKHTPGPWILHEDGRSIYTDHTNEAGMFSIAQGFAGNDPAMDRANLALAAAAPDLLKIAQAYHNHLRTAAHTDGQVATYEHIAAVIAKATNA
jgi:hypothetical protein